MGLKLQWRSRKNAQMCYVKPTALNPKWQLFKNKLKQQATIRVRKRETEDGQNPSDGIFPIVKESGKYYMCLIKNVTRQSKNIESRDQIVALDPGVRCFQTYFSQKECGTIGDKINKETRKINKKIDNLTSLQSKAKSKTKYAMKNAVRY